MNCLFWNVDLGKRVKVGRLNSYIVDIVLENKIDILALGEYADDMNDLKRRFMNEKYDIYELENLGSRITVLTTYPPHSFERIKDKRHYTLFRVQHSNVGKVMFGFTHFFSKSMKDENDFSSKATRMMREIELNEDINESDYTVLAGDFNMNPFEKGMLQGGAFHAFPTVHEAKKNKHIIDEENYKMFYNPMWKYFGESNEVPGTYYTTPTHTYGLYWNIFDQVLYRPSLMEIVGDVEIKIKIRGNDLIKGHKILVSDHLPLYFKLKEIL
ncbi:endonuclease/exonuclease/phosphatase family protein [Bacillus cereus]|uniref:endonuclease/exonuclease/phosphatase family protein n=1 Tax=Bacillus cereus TaxID=1396 RepID=UPI0034D3F8D7